MVDDIHKYIRINHGQRGRCTNQFATEPTSDQLVPAMWPI